MCVIFVVFTDCERGTKPISTNLGSTEAGQHGQMRGARFVAVRLEVVAVAGLISVSRCVFGGAELLSGVFFFFWFSSNAHGLLQACGALPFLPLY